MNTALNMQEEDILRLLEEYFQTDYSIKEFCYLNEDIDEETFSVWINKYAPERAINPFADINIKETGADQGIRDERKPGRPKKQQPDPAPVLFARIGDIELYQQVSSSYLKSLKS